MLKLLLLLSFFAGVVSGGASATPAEKKCAWLVSRTYVPTAQLQAALAELKTDPLIASLEERHLLAVQASNTTSPMTWLVFHPFWIFENDSTLEEVLEYFDPNDESQPRYVHGIAQWVDEWEALYENHFGELSRRWRRGGKKRFVQKLLVECAVRYAIRGGMGNEPKIFLSEPHGEKPSYSVLTSGIESAFRGNPELFQKSFDEVYRRRMELRLGEGRTNVPAVEQEVRAQLRGIGINLRAVRNWRPQVSADYRTRRSGNDIELAVESIRAFGESSIPLAGLLREGTSGEGDVPTRFDWEVLSTVARRHGGPHKFLELVNAELVRKGLPAIEPQLGTKTLTQELVVQAGVLASVETDTFDGFQSEKPNDPLYLDMGNEVVQRSGLRLYEINRLVTQRLAVSE